MVARSKLVGRADFLLTFLPVIIVQTIYIYIYIYIYIHTHTDTGISMQAYKHTRMSKEVGEKREKKTEKRNS